MGACSSSPPDLTEQNKLKDETLELFSHQSVWTGRMIFNDIPKSVNDYLEITIESRGNEIDRPLSGSRVISIAESKFTNSTRFEFLPEKNKKEKLWELVFYYYDEYIKLRATTIEPDKFRILGLCQRGESKGEFQLVRTMAPNSIAPLQKSVFTKSTKRIIQESSDLANMKFEHDEKSRKEKITKKASQNFPSPKIVAQLPVGHWTISKNNVHGDQIGRAVKIFYEGKTAKLRLEPFKKLEAETHTVKIERGRYVLFQGEESEQKLTEISHNKLVWTQWKEKIEYTKEKTHKKVTKRTSQSPVSIVFPPEKKLSARVSSSKKRVEREESEI